MKRIILSLFAFIFSLSYIYAACSGRTTYSAMGASGAFTNIGSGSGPGMVRLCVEGNTFAGGMCSGNDAGIYIYDCARTAIYGVINETTAVGYCMSMNICDGCMDIRKICAGISGDITLSWSTVDNGASLCSGGGTIPPFPSPPGTDCLGATPICASATFPGNSNGEGFEEFMCAGVNGGSNGGCLTGQATLNPAAGGEHNSRWYRFVPQVGGTLTIDIAPSASRDDYDFALWQSNNCSNLGTPLRCNYCDGNGATGIGPAGTQPSVPVSFGCNNYSSTVNVTAGLTYYLLVNGFGFPQDPTYNITFGGTASLNCSIVCATPTVNNTITATTCGLPNGAINLSVGGGVLPYTFNWSNGSSAQNISALAANTYTVTVTTASVPPCSTTASFIVAASSNTVVAGISGNLTICPGGSTSLTATGGGNYTWSNGRGTAGNNITAIGTYTVTVTNAVGCKSTSSVSIVQAVTTASISGATTMCSGGSTTLTASGGGTYLWNNGRVTAASNITAAGTYTVTVTNNGCTSTAQSIVSLTNVTASISGATTMCSGGSTTLTASGGGTYLWNNGRVTAANNITAAGTYTVTVTNNGCTSTAQSIVTLTNVTASISGATTMCSGGSTTLTASGGGTYLWNNGRVTAANNGS